MSIARRVLPSRLELKSFFGSLSAAPLANVSFTTPLYVSPVHRMPPSDHTGTPAGLLGFFHFRSSTMPLSAARMILRTSGSVFSRQSPVLGFVAVFFAAGAFLDEA